MSKTRVLLCIVICSFLSIMTVRAELKPTKIYAFGFTATFNDSIVYLTDIQELDSAWVSTKTEFLYSRENYSAQLKEHMIMQGVQDPTCVIIYALKRDKAEKKLMKLRKKYDSSKRGDYIIKTIPSTDFHFECISAADDEFALQADSKEARKAARKAAKQAAKERKQKQKDSKRPLPPGGANGGPGGAPGGGFGGPGGGHGGPM